MTFTQVLPTVSQLSHQDKLRLIHFLLLAVAKEEGCNLETSDSENTLLEQLAATDAIVWSPQTGVEPRYVRNSATSLGIFILYGFQFYQFNHKLISANWY